MIPQIKIIQKSPPPERDGSKYQGLATALRSAQVGQCIEFRSTENLACVRSYVSRYSSLLSKRFSCLQAEGGFDIYCVEPSTK